MPKTISGRALAAREEIASGKDKVKTTARYKFTTNDYERAYRVAKSGKQLAIDAMDEQIIPITAAVRMLALTNEELETKVEEARFKVEKKNHRQISARGKPKPQLLLELLGSTYTDWKGAENNLPINSQTIPSDANKLSDVVRLCKVVRKTVMGMLDKIEREIKRCSAKTTDRKTS